MNSPQQWHVGDVTITSVVELEAMIPGEAVLRDASTDRVQAVDWLRPNFADDDVLVIGTHFAGPCAGHVVSDGDVWRIETS